MLIDSVQGAMGLDEVEHDIRTPMEGYHQQLPGGATSFVDAYPGLEESERPFVSALKSLNPRALASRRLADINAEREEN